MNKSIPLFGIVVAVAAFSSSAFAQYVEAGDGYVADAGQLAASTVTASTPIAKASKPGTSATKYDPPVDANGVTYQRSVITTVSYRWVDPDHPAPDVDINQAFSIDIDLKASASNPSVTSKAEAFANFGGPWSVTNGNDKRTTTAGEYWLGYRYGGNREITIRVGAQAKASVHTLLNPPQSSGTSQSSITVRTSALKFYYVPITDFPPL